MYDPMTVAFQIPNPFARHYDPEARKRGDRFHGAWSRRAPLLVIWHKDSERHRNGCRGDHTCDWHGSYWRWNDRAEKQAKDMASWSNSGHGVRYFDHPELPRVLLLPNDFSENAPRENVVFHEVGQGDALALTLAAFRTIAWQLDRKDLKGRSLRDALTMGSSSDACQWFAPTLSTEERVGRFRGLVRAYLMSTRPWWRHPRWHFWHWRIQVPAWKRFVRWLKRTRAEETAEMVNPESCSPGL